MRKRVLAALLSLFCTVMFLALPASAAEVEAEGGETENFSLELHYYDKGNKRALSGVTFNLYKVGEGSPQLKGKGKYSFDVAEDFNSIEGIGASLSEMDFWRNADALGSLASTLATHVSDKGVEPAREDETSSSGYLSFTEMEPGLYLVLGEQKVFNAGNVKETYDPQPLLIPLPYPDSIDSSSKNDVQVEVKFVYTSSGANPVYHTLTINYIYEDGAEAYVTYFRDELPEGYAYSVPSPVIPGYVADIALVKGTMPASDVEYTVVYSIEPSQPPVTPNPVPPGTPETPTTPGTPNTPADQAEIPNRDVPLADLTPEDLLDIFSDVPQVETVLDDLIDIFTETPLADWTVDDLMDIINDVPLTDLTPEELLEILDEIPLAHVPGTGDNSQIWEIFAVMSGAGLVWLGLRSKKREH